MLAQRHTGFGFNIWRLLKSEGCCLRVRISVLTFKFRVCSGFMVFKVLAVLLPCALR